MRSSRYTPSAYGDIDSGGWDNPPPRSNHSSQGFTQGREVSRPNDNYNTNREHNHYNPPPPNLKSNDSWEPLAAPRSESNSFQAKEPAPPPPRFDQPQHRASRYEEEEELDEEEEYTAPAAEPVYGSYVAWTGVT